LFFYVRRKKLWSDSFFFFFSLGNDNFFDRRHRRDNKNNNKRYVTRKGDELYYHASIKNMTFLSSSSSLLVCFECSPSSSAVVRVAARKPRCRFGTRRRRGVGEIIIARKSRHPGEIRKKMKNNNNNNDALVSSERNSFRTDRFSAAAAAAGVRCRAALGEGESPAAPKFVSPFQDVADAMAKGLEEASSKTDEGEKERTYPKLTKENVDEALEEIRPYVINDGGNIEVVAVSEEDGIVAVRLLGACASCASSQATMKGGVESVLRKTFGDEIFKEVVNVSGDVGQAPPELTKEAVAAHLKSIEERVKGYGGVVKCLEVDGRKGNVVLGFRGPKPLAAATAQSLQKTFPFIKTASLKELDDDDDDDDDDE